MKLLQLVEAAAGGVGRHVMDLTAGLLARGHEVHLVYSGLRWDQVFCGDLRNLLKEPSFHALDIPMRRAPSGSDLLAIRSLRRYVRRCGPFDLIHCHSTKAGLIGRLGLIGHSSRRLYTPHGFFTMDPTRSVTKRRIWARFESALSGLGDAVVVVSREEHKHALDLGIDPAKIHMVQNGVPIDSLARSVPSRAQLREAWRIGDDEVCVGFVGRFVPVKSPETILRSFAAARAREAARLVMVGDGPLRASLRRLSGYLGIEARVVWLGERDAKTLMHAFDVFALTSESEGHPLAVLEALARGLPIVATSVGGISATVLPGVNGFIAPVRGVSEIADALATLVQNPDLRARMGEASRRLVQEFSIDRMVDQTVALYEHVVSGSRSRVEVSARAAAAS
jgi:glycosyltransferase involved in cell wall biosynthesis